MVVYASSVTPVGYWSFKVEKRAAPTVTGSSSSRVVFPSNIGGAGGQVSASIINTSAAQINPAITISTASAGWMDGFTVYASAEL